MTFRKYAASKAVTLCFLGIGLLAMAVFMAIAGAGGGLILSAALLLALLTVGWVVCGFLAERRRLKKLESTLEALPEKYLLGEVIPQPSGAVEREYYEIMKTVSRAAVGIVEQSLREKEEYCAYVESWIHEIKTPLTACSLILSNGGDPGKLRRELKRADNLTESILYYARMRTAERDTQIREFRVSGVMDEAVRSQMELLIAAGISVEVEGDFTVHSDPKSLCFMLKQLLINCAKYCPGCRVRMAAQGNELTVEDNGPGIPSHELRRVTERGFTGSAGRRLGGGTGMGLYLVREHCRRLGITLRVESEASRFTRFRFLFPNFTEL